MNPLFLPIKSSVSGFQDVPPGPFKPPPENLSIASVFSAPLIIGASVSAGMRTTNPVERALRRQNLSPPILNVAKRGSRGRDLVHRIQAMDLRRFSVIVGIDLFFWDTVLPPSLPSMPEIERLCRMAESRKVPLLLGTVPDLQVPALQLGLRKVIEEISRAAEPRPFCRILDLHEINGSILKHGGFTLDNRHYGVSAVAPDGIHLSSAASEYLGVKILEALNEPFPERSHSLVFS